jgi:hypothetical protein
MVSSTAYAYAYPTMYEAVFGPHRCAVEEAISGWSKIWCIDVTRKAEGVYVECE